jgi:metal-responsive CopG/Arc/MetJ family transcriptional regulator
MAKFQVSMDDELETRLEEYADRHFMTRSGVVTLACNQLLLTEDVQRSIKTIALAMRRIADSNKIDDKSKEELREFELLAKMFAGTSEPL